MGQRNGPSFLDVKVINLAHGCPSICTQQLACKNDGFMDSRDCSKCKCPAGFGGALCDSVQTSTNGQNCGGGLQATNQFQTLSSNSNSGSCYWQIQSPAGTQIEFQFNAGSFSLSCDTLCTDNFVEVKVGPDFQTTGPRFCCRNDLKTMQSTGNFMVVIKFGQGSFSAQYRFGKI